MSVNLAIVAVMMIFMAWAVVDKLFLKNRFGYGEKFDEAFGAMGPLALSITGIMCFAPVLGKLLTPVFAPLFNLLGADPGMLAGALLASDMGGFSLAQSMTQNPDVVVLSGIFLGSMMGVAVIFVIPYTVTVTADSDKPYLSRGIMAGIIPIPVGCLIAGLLSGMPIGMLWLNLLPSTLLAVLLALSLWLAPGRVAQVFGAFSNLLTILMGVFLAAAIVEAMTGFVVIPGMSPIGPQLEIVGYIVIMLAGAYPFIHFLKTVLTGPLSRLGGLIGVNDVTMAGILASLASAIPMYPMIKDMNPRGKVMAVAFSIGAGFALGDILAYTSTQAPDYIFPMIVGKIAAGVLGACIAALAMKKARDPREPAPLARCGAALHKR